MDKTEVQQPIKQTKQGRRMERRQENQRKEQERLRAARNRRFTLIGSIAVAAAVIIGVIVFSVLNGNKSASANNAAAVNTSDSAAPVVDNIACEVNEQSAYHIHVHVSMYINGQQQSIPANVGINQQQSCLYWLHTHDTTGVIHIEAPQQITYKLGNFFHIWNQQFAQSQYPVELNDTTGWQIYVDGKAYKGDFNSIPLNAHTLITMAYNSPKAPIDTVYNWNGL